MPINFGKLPGSCDVFIKDLMTCKDQHPKDYKKHCSSYAEDYKECIHGDKEVWWIIFKILSLKRMEKEQKISAPDFFKTFKFILSSFTFLWQLKRLETIRRVWEKNQARKMEQTKINSNWKKMISRKENDYIIFLDSEEAPLFSLRKKLNKH